MKGRAGYGQAESPSHQQIYGIRDRRYFGAAKITVFVLAIEKNMERKTQTQEKGKTNTKTYDKTNIP